MASLTQQLHQIPTIPSRRLLAYSLQASLHPSGPIRQLIDFPSPFLFLLRPFVLSLCLSPYAGTIKPLERGNGVQVGLDTHQQETCRGRTPLTSVITFVNDLPFASSRVNNISSIRSLDGFLLTD